MTEDELVLLDQLGPALLGVKRLDEELRSLMEPGPARGGEGGGGSRPGSKPPAPMHLMQIVVDAWEITRSWSGYLFVDTWGSSVEGVDARQWMWGRHSTAQGYCDWLYRHRELIVGRSWAVDIVDELDDLQRRMEDALPKDEPPPVREVPETARGLMVTASEAASLTKIPVGTIRRWGTSGAVPCTSTKRGTKLYKIGDILDRHSAR